MVKFTGISLTRCPDRGTHLTLHTNYTPTNWDASPNPVRLFIYTHIARLKRKFYLATASLLGNRRLNVGKFRKAKYRVVIMRSVYQSLLAVRAIERRK